MTEQVVARVEFDDEPDFEVAVPVLVVGAGACGFTAALAAADLGAEVLVVEREAEPAGSTALSSGLVPAAGTRWQGAVGIEDSVELLAGDVLRKAHCQTDPDFVRAVCKNAAPTLEWLSDAHGLEFVVLDSFTYPGHSALRMHAHPDRTGRALVEALAKAANAAGIDLLSHATVDTLIMSADGKTVRGVRLSRPDGSTEAVGCGALVLACNGYGGNPALVASHIPEMSDALYFGHPGNQGHAVLWGQQLGAQSADLGAYQGHGSVASPHGLLITWAVMMEGGIQVNQHGERFSNEHLGYSEQAVEVLAQPGQIAWNLYDERCHDIAMTFEDYRQAVELGAVRKADSLTELAAITQIDEARLADTLRLVDQFASGTREDPFGRDFSAQPPLAAPFRAVRVTGAVFHTQGGLRVDSKAAVLRSSGEAFANLFAGGGAARGLSGPAVWGYLSGNGLLSAVSLGQSAGASAAAVALATPKA